MSDFEMFKTQGESLGLDKGDLLNFIRDGQIRTDSERKLKAEIERDQRQEQRAQAKEEADRAQAQEEREADRGHELELARIQGEQNTSRLNTSHHESGYAKTPKLPQFSENKDNMDAYLRRFERFAIVQKWEQNDWATHLSALITGKALDVYSRLAATDAKDYDRLKGAILKRYNYTEDGFRMKFRDSKPDKDETPDQFGDRLDSYLTRWLELSDTSEDYEALKTLFLREQFMNSCGKYLATYLRERGPKTLRELYELAERYLEARGWSLGENNTGNKQKFNKNKTHEKGTKPQDNSVTDKSSYNQSNGKTSSYRKTAFSGKCFKCDRFGHKSVDCRNVAGGQKVFPKTSYTSAVAVDTQSNTTSPKQNCACTDCPSHNNNKQACANVVSDDVLDGSDWFHVSAGSKESDMGNLPIYDGLVNGQNIRVLRDSGCTSVIVSRHLVSDEQLTGEVAQCTTFNRDTLKLPIAKIKVNTPFLVKELNAMCCDNLICDLILGNVPGAREACDPDTEWKRESVNVVTRAQEIAARKVVEPLIVNELDHNQSDITVAKLKEAMEQDETLQMCEVGQEPKVRGQNKYWFIKKNGMLYRMYQSPKHNYGIAVKQLVVPQNRRRRVMGIAHDSPMGGHLGIGKTIDRVQTEFYWPGLHGDVTRYCKSCDVCQRTIAKGKVTKVPLGKMPIMSEPFQRVAMDLIGPLTPVSKNGYRYVLTVVDYATRYPEAVPLKNIDTISVAEALLSIYSRVGFPREVLSDMGTQFVSDVMREINRLLSIKQLNTTPYHPIANGLVEKFNGTLKSMLRKMCCERPEDWDRYLPAVLFAYREVPQDSVGFSPFELLYGRTVRGPMTILKELWTQEIKDPEVRSTYQYVLDLRERLETTCKLAQEALGQSQKRYKHYYDKKSRKRSYKVGDSVLLLLPTDHNKLTMQWKGPYKVSDIKFDNDYIIMMNGKSKIFHVNMLKKYIPRQDVPEEDTGDDENQMAVMTCANVIIDEEMDEGEAIDTPVMEPKLTHLDVHIGPELCLESKTEVSMLLRDFCDIFTEVPGDTHLVEHEIRTYDEKPIRVTPYKIPYSVRQEIDTEVGKMLKLDIIEPSRSPYSAPVVLVAKKDSTKRFCIDYRRVNSNTLFDNEPTANAPDIYAKLSNDKIFTKIDLTKGYWQIRMAENSKEKTAFVTHAGCYQFKRMPFGLMNSAATFNRMMRKLLSGISQVDSYIDDILIHTPTWHEHLVILRLVFQRLREANLTIKPSKCQIGYPDLEFLGHYVGKKTLGVNPELVKKILDAQIPTSKKQVRSFLGLAGYYRSYIPNYSTISAPLSDLTKKGQRSKDIKWDECHDRAFLAIKRYLTNKPILHLPDMSQQFILQTDASDTGVGSVLLQEHDGKLFPIAYNSRKLLPREKNYSAIEKECLGLVWAIDRFKCYLYGREFILQTDHQPLVYLNSCKLTNGRLMRWALSLQSYKFRIEAVKGTQNVGADYMSRIV